MKALKLGVFALALGFFAASCGNSESATTTPVDSPAVEAQPEVAPTTEPAAPAADSTASTTTTTTTTTTDSVKK